MQKRGVLIFFCTVVMLFLQGQSKQLFWERLKYDTTQNLIINADTEFPEKDWDPIFSGRFASPLKVDTNIYGWINGTGRLYKMEMNEGSAYFFKRIDSTEALLYNVAAFPFVYKNRIYTLGGYGIWRTNGQLRVFNEAAKEWDIVKLNKEIPLMFGKKEGCLWYDPKSGKIYIGFYEPVNDAVNEENKPVSEVYELNLETKEWNKLGDLNQEFVSHINKFINIGMSSKGLFCMLDNRVYLLNFEENKAYRLRENTAYWQLLGRWFSGSTFYFKDSILYAHNANRSLFDSVKIHTADFEKDTVSLYTKERSGFFYFYFLLPVIVVIALFIFLRKKKRADQSAKENNNQNNYETPKLSVTEFDILQLVFTNSLDGRKTTIEELNSLMGLSKKNVDIQKKQRSDMLIALNRKLAVISETNNPVVDKIRSETDGRMFEYFIDPLLMDKVGSVIKLNISESE